MFKYIFIGFLVSLNAFADFYAGSGSAAVVCSKNNQIQSVELLDLYEARTRGLEIQKNISTRFDEEAQKIIDKLKGSEIDTLKLNFLKGKFKPILQGSKLELLKDNYPVILPRGCEMQQLTFVANERTIWIDSVLYNLLDNAGKLALVFHEYMYRDETKYFPTDSRYVRTIIGYAFSTSDPFENPVSLWKMVTGFACMDEDEKFTFMAKKVPLAKNKYKFTFLFINGHQMWTTTTGVFELAYDLKDGPSGKEVVSTALLESKINPNESVTVRSSEKGLVMSWKGTFPEDELKNIRFDCKKIDIGQM